MIGKDDAIPSENANAVPLGVAQLDRLVPKFCTNIEIAVFNNGNMVLTLAYSDGSGSTAALIDRVVIDMDHAEKLSSVLTNILQEHSKK